VTLRVAAEAGNRVRAMPRFVAVAAIIVITLRPWPDPVFWGQGSVRSSEAGVLILLVIAAGALFVLNGARMPRYSVFYAVPLLVALSISASLAANASHLTFADLIEGVRPLYVLALLGIGYFGARTTGPEKFEKYLLLVIVAVAMFQAVIIPFQLFIPGSLELLHTVYSDRKLEYGAVRATGTFGNPNHLAFFLFVAQAAVLRLCTGARRLALWALFYAAILFTGSLAMVVFAGAAMIVFLVSVATGRLTTLVAAWALLSAAVVAFVALLAIGIEGSDSFPRLARIKIIIDQGFSGISELHNFEVRVAHWQHLLQKFSLDTPATLLFGYGPMKGRGLDAVDNEFLFVLLRHGVVGIGVAVANFAMVASVFWGRSYPGAVFGRCVVVMFAALTPFFEVFSLWRFMPYYLVPLGLVMASYGIGDSGRVFLFGRPGKLPHSVANAQGFRLV